MTPTCSIVDCDRPVHGRGWCKRHNQVARRHNGDPLGARRYVTGTVEERWWAYVDKTDTHWLWTGATTEAGDRPTPHVYGVLSVDGTPRRAHRIGWELLVGPIPDGLQIDHVCRETLCVRPHPAHLEPVTNRENTIRGEAPEQNRQWRLALTHCKRGHAFADHAYHNGKQRVCRPCQRIRAAERRAERAAPLT